MSFLEKRLLVFFTLNMNTYFNKQGVELEMDESNVFTASSVLNENRNEDWYISVSVQSDTVTDFIDRYAIGKLADLETITPGMLRELYYSNQATMFLLFHGTALWFTRKADNSTLVTGDLHAITFEELTEPGDFLRVGEQMIKRSYLPVQLRMIHAKK